MVNYSWKICFTKLYFMITCLLLSRLWRWNWHRVPKRRPTTIWRRGNIQKNIYNMRILSSTAYYFQHRIYIACLQSPQMNGINSAHWKQDYSLVLSYFATPLTGCSSHHLTLYRNDRFKGKIELWTINSSSHSTHSDIQLSTQNSMGYILNFILVT